jgi:hypothetical protein
LKKPDPAIDVIADPSGRDDPFVRIEGGHAADRETVSLMGVRHRIGHAPDPGQAGHVAGLFESQIMPDVLKEPG